MPSSRPSRAGRKTRLILPVASLLFGLLLLEILLQVASLAVRLAASRTRVEQPAPPVGEEFRILCLGESTTHGFGARSYPDILESRLRDSGYGPRFRVINEGRVGQHSIFLADLLPRLLERHRPHMVIVMMGINDELYFSPSKLVVPVNVELALLKLRTYRLARLVSTSVRRLQARRASERASAGPAGDPGAVEEFNRRSILYADADYWRQHEDVERELLSLIRQARETSRPANGGEDTALEIAEPYSFHYHVVYNTLRSVYLARGEAAKAEELFLEALERHPTSQFFHRGLAAVYSETGRPELAARYRRVADELATGQLREVTRTSYRRIEALLREDGIALVAMQYPLRSVAVLKHLLDDSSYPIYVDNEEIFRLAVARSGYREIFFDRFGGDIGHCTEAGNTILADNLMATVFEPMFGSPSNRDLSRETLLP